MVHRIRTPDELEAFFAASATQPALLLKHSTRCPISAAAYDAFQAVARSLPDRARYAVVYVVEDRPLSNAVAERTQVKHESPQVLLVKDGVVRWHASHWDITVDALERALTRF
ncbi:bacillithiol system redox-active protein YtxJ [Calditerricola satsumensis]|uniref:Bacillithiol system redox-active protein YtxJ n=1 Tax=Calditerricola satsumensis TaxID=373054 RepID=A0A8J3FF68_9BACI|nr:bacillithiol system redox-active protein YtxJ [Calditerricola satsumensis]GGK03418.1 hypothetical protein GCM10007043_16920 [Calditerricola satsumensis]